MDEDYLIDHLLCDYILVILMGVYAYADTLTAVCSNREKMAGNDVAFKNIK